MKTVFCYNWTEYDDGVQRGDGQTIHIDAAEAAKYVKEYLAAVKDSPGYYCRPSSSLHEINISDEDYKRLAKVGTVRVPEDEPLQTITKIKWRD